MKEVEDWWEKDHPEEMWVLIDKSNSNPKSKNYLWWFETEQIALDFLKHHTKTYGVSASSLYGPFKYNKAK